LTNTEYSSTITTDSFILKWQSCGFAILSNTLSEFLHVERIDYYIPYRKGWKLTQKGSVCQGKIYSYALYRQQVHAGRAR